MQHVILSSQVFLRCNNTTETLNVQQTRKPSLISGSHLARPVADSFRRRRSLFFRQ